MTRHPLPALVAAALPTTATSVALADETRIGMTLDYNEVMSFYDNRGVDIVDHYDTIGASAVFDLEYVRVSAGYATNFGNHIRFVDGNEEKDDQYRISYLNTTVVGKLPLRLAQDELILWPALGLRSAINLEYAHDGGERVNDESNDWHVVGGVGLDYNVSKSVALTSSLLATYNLTPGMGDFADNPRGLSLGLGLGALLRL